jgi:hypothetical protein
LDIPFPCPLLPDNYSVVLPDAIIGAIQIPVIAASSYNPGDFIEMILNDARQITA